MSVLSTLGGADDWYMQYALLAAITGVVLVNLKTFPGVWHVGEMNYVPSEENSIADSLSSASRCDFSKAFSRNSWELDCPPVRSMPMEYLSTISPEEFLSSSRIW